MNKFKRIVIFLVLMNFLSACGAFAQAGKALRNERTKTTDEFLVKKREPLVLPPDYENLPEPGLAGTKEDNKKKINKILKIQEDKSSSNSRATSVEQSIINKIGK